MRLKNKKKSIENIVEKQTKALQTLSTDQQLRSIGD